MAAILYSAWPLAFTAMRRGNALADLSLSVLGGHTDGRDRVRRHRTGGGADAGREGARCAGRRRGVATGPGVCRCERRGHRRACSRRLSIGPDARAIADITSTRPELGVLVVGPMEPNLDVMIALASGAFGYLPSGSTPAAIADAVDTMLAGEAVLPHAVSSPLVRHLRWGGRGFVVRALDGHDVELTNREWGVLVLLRQGRSTAEIARHLVVSTGTVRTHVAALVHKFGVRDRDGLAQSTGADPARRPTPPVRSRPRQSTDVSAR